MSVLSLGITVINIKFLMSAKIAFLLKIRLKSFELHPTYHKSQSSLFSVRGSLSYDGYKYKRSKAIILQMTQ